MILLTAIIEIMVGWLGGCGCPKAAVKTAVTAAVKTAVKTAVKLP